MKIKRTRLRCDSFAHAENLELEGVVQLSLTSVYTVCRDSIRSSMPPQSGDMCMICVSYLGASIPHIGGSLSFVDCAL